MKKIDWDKMRTAKYPCEVCGFPQVWDTDTNEYFCPNEALHAVQKSFNNRGYTGKALS